MKLQKPLKHMVYKCPIGIRKSGSKGLHGVAVSGDWAKLISRADIFGKNGVIYLGNCRFFPGKAQNKVPPST